MNQSDYISNEVVPSYRSVFEKNGVGAVIRDSVIGGRRSVLFTSGWKHLRTADTAADYSGVYETSVMDFEDRVDDSGWNVVCLPHDFQIVQTGDMGSRAALTQDMAGWYRKKFTLPDSLADRRVAVRFDGIYQDSEVFINGQRLPEFSINAPKASPYSGTHYYGYKTFEVDLTGYLRFGSEKENVLTVAARDMHSSSRWYTGGGINRNVWLTVSDRVHVSFLGSYVYYELSEDYSYADVTAETEIENDTDREVQVVLRQTLLKGCNPDYIQESEEVETVNPKIMFSRAETVGAGETRIVRQRFRVEHPKLWDLGWEEGKHLYTLDTRLYVGEYSEDSRAADTYLTEFGFRRIEWDAEKGVFLNGRHIKLQGVCQHENLGSLGSANDAAALERQLVILKEMGVNAVRTAHNICTPDLIALCNRMGLLVLEEAYDAWDDRKDGAYSLGGKGIFFDSYESDIRSMVRRDRNAPCVFMWSIGNEIVSTVWGSMEASRQKVSDMLDFIQDEDAHGKRFVTLAQMQWSTPFSREVSAFICDYLRENYGDYGVMGQNYRDLFMDEVHREYPGYKMLGTEQSSAVRSRGVYHRGPYVYAHEDLQVSSLDNAGPAYFLSAEDMYKFDRNRDWYGGEFIWTGFDYIGESTPYDTKNAYFGIVDTAGLPKDIYYFYRSAWNREKDTLHIFPCWNHNDGDQVDVFVSQKRNKLRI